MRQNREKVIWAVTLPAAIGVVFCLLNAVGADLLCLSSGCDIYAGYSLGGISIDLLGAAGFALILFVSTYAAKRSLAERLLKAVLVTGLVIDTLFLVWQILFWPCTSCLVVAILMAACFLGALVVFPPFRSRVAYGVLLLWFAAFMPVAADAGKELFLSPWPAMGSPDSPIAVYFSPTCPSCKDTVRNILDLPSLTGQVAFYPIAKNDKDLSRLALLNKKDEGGDVSLRDLFREQAEESPLNPGLALRWKLVRNKMALAQIGADKVPLVMGPTLVLGSHSLSRPAVSGEADFPSYLFDATPLEEGCSAGSTMDEDCD